MMMRMEARVADGVFIGCTPTEIIEPAMEQVRVGEAKARAGDEADPREQLLGLARETDRKEAYRESRASWPGGPASWNGDSSSCGCRPTRCRR